MTEISTYNPDQTPTLYDPNKAPTLMEKGVAKLRQHAELKAMAFDYADFITKTGACPTIYKNKPMDAAAAIIRGTALGFDPDGALEAFFVINGKTGMYARAMVAVAENAGCELWEVEASDESVTLSTWSRLVISPIHSGVVPSSQANHSAAVSISSAANFGSYRMVRWSNATGVKSSCTSTNNAHASAPV